MRSFIDEEGKIAWIFDEETHPKGNKKVSEVKEEAPKHSLFKKK